MGLDCAGPVERELGPNQPVREAARLDVDRLHVPRHLLAVAAEDDLERSVRALAGTVADYHRHVGFDRHRELRRSRCRELHSAQIDPGRRPRNLSELDVVDEQRRDDLHPDTVASRSSLPDMSRTLSEADSKSLLAPLGVPFGHEKLVQDPSAAAKAATDLGFPVAAKLCGDNIAHKTERGLVRLGLGDPESVATAAEELLAAATPEDKASGVLIAPMVAGSRELIAGMSHDEHFGATVLFGVGGVATEALGDVAVRLAPIARIDAEEMMDQLRCRTLLGEFRGEPAVDREAVVDVLMALSDAASLELDTGETIVSVDLNPMIVSDGRPVAVDALVEVASPAEVAG